MCQGLAQQALIAYDIGVRQGAPMRIIITQMTHEELDTPVADLSDYAIMSLKHELLRKVTELSNELKAREEDSTGIFTSW